MFSFIAFWMGGAGATEVEQTIDGSGLRFRRRKIHAPVRPRDLDRLPEDIRREQLETERYLAELEQKVQPPAPVADTGKQSVAVSTPAAAPIDPALARAAAAERFMQRVRSASAAAFAQRRTDLVLLLALD